MGSCAWVTQALHEDNVEKALVLGKCLRRVLTRKTLAVVVNPSISLALRDALEATFDFVLPIDQGKCGTLKDLNIGEDNLAKAYALSFTFFDKCIYLPPNSILLKNCDELFEHNGNPGGKGVAMGFKPDREGFKKMIEFVNWHRENSSELNDMDGLLMQWIENQGPGKFTWFGEPNFTIVKLQGKHTITNDDSLAICQLVDLPAKAEKLDPEKNGFSSAGLLEKFIYRSWLETYKNEVKIPSLTTDICMASFSSFKEPIAIVGMSCRYPSSNNLSEFWGLLIEGRDGIRTPPDYRWTKEHSIHQKPETRQTQAGFLTVPVDEFDAKFFGISPKEMIFIDPQHRLLHELVWESLEDAGINPLALAGSQAGVFMGSWRNDYYDILQRSSSREFYRGYMGNSIGAGAARISHLLGLTGPCVATESGCSAAMVAVHMAIRSLQSGESSMAFACGVNMLLHPFTTDIMPMVTAPDGHCKSFDANANGFGRAEGAGVLILKRLSDAVKDNDSIWGVIKGSSIYQEGVSKSMGTPTVHCESMAMRNALQDAGIHPSKVSYVESHGTGTIVGDPMEVNAIGNVYSEGRTEPLVIGSVKTNVGHTESCSGITGIMKVVLSMKNEVIPPHRNFKELNPNINLDVIPAQLPLEAVKWPKSQGKKRIAGISSFGITGTDGHVILEEPSEHIKQRIVLSQFERPLHLMTVSARTEEALDILLSRYQAALSVESLPENVFSQMAYTANIGRAQFPYRAAIVAKSCQDAAAMIESNKLIRDEATEISPKVCFLFTGQGSQYPGMGKNLYSTSPVFRMHFDRCEDILKKRLNISIANAFWSDDSNNELCHQTLYSQTGIFVIEYCLMKLWESWGVTPDACLGHSLGEFCAAVCAGLLTFEEAITLVAERCRLIDSLPSGKMLVVKADKSTVESYLKKANVQLDFAAINSPDQTVVAGDSQVILDFADGLKSKNVKCAVLQSSHAFHSSHMDPILAEYKTLTTKLLKGKIPELRCQYISGLLGKTVEPEDINWSEYWVNHTREKVNFMEASRVSFNEIGCRLFVEIGPNPVLTAFTMMNNEGKEIPVCLPSLRKTEPDWKTMLETAAKLHVSGAVTIDWNRFDQFYDRKKVGDLLPKYPFIGQKYWPSITSSTGQQIHPLLGSSIPNPTQAKLYQNSLSLQNVEYLKDHVIGTQVVFPGAGYMEALLMAGHATLDGVSGEFQLPRRPIQLENFRIEAPLALEDGTGCNCQTVVTHNTIENEGTSGLLVKIYHEMKEGEETASKWVSHATATFSPYNPGSGLQEQVELQNSSAYAEVMERLMTSGQEENSAQEFYDKVADVGLKFGPSFRTLRKVWRGEDGFLAEVNVPKDAQNYLVHPTLIDAMIQASVFHGEKSKKIEKKLRVPIGVERFIWWRSVADDTQVEAVEDTGSQDENGEKASLCYIYSQSNSKTILLLDKEGRPCCALVKVEAIETTAKSIKAMLETQVRSIPDVYKMHWKPTMGPKQYRVDLSIIKDVVTICGESSRDKSDYSEGVLQIRRETDLLAANYATVAFLTLGWSPKLGDTFKVAELINQLGIKQQHKQLTRQFLTFLEAENLLSSVDDDVSGDRTWTVVNLPEAKEALESQNSKLFDKLVATDIADQIHLLRACGVKLDKVLTGSESALRILFPDDDSKPSGAKFYDNVFKKVREILYSSWSETWKSMKRVYKERGLALPVIRILEVGAGTGAITESVIDSMFDWDVQFEYHYTDISAAFFPGAEKRFEKHRKNFIFRKLNLEQDLTSQGFAPNYFDFIFGAQVIHATRDIKETFINMRQLLRDGGNIVLNESLGGRRHIDLIFGLLEGFWRFTDFEIRPHQAMMQVNKWEEVARPTGFDKFGYAHIHDMGILAYRAGSKEAAQFDKLLVNLNKDMQMIQQDLKTNWVFFYGEEETEWVQEMKKKMDWLGRKNVILVKSSPVEDIETGRNEIEIKPDSMEDMEKTFTTIKGPVEGILVTWGLCGGDNRDQSRIALLFLNLVKTVLKMDKKTMPQVVVMTAGQYAIGDILCTNPSSSTLIGMSRSIANEHSELRLRGIDVSPSQLYSSMDTVFQEIFTHFNDQVAHFCAFRDEERFIPKMFPEKVAIKGNFLTLPTSATNRFQLIHPKSRSIQDLEFGDLPSFVLGANEIEVKVKCSALNFKDILNILKPIDEFKDSNGVGFDFAGVVTAVGESVSDRKVGDAVFGINIMGNALPSHIKLPHDAVAQVPDILTYTEAACFPAVFSTAYYCLVNVANCQRGEWLLIHTASGGVGLLTIQLAKYFGLNVVCTAGSQRKRAYLRSLGVEHVFHSRNTEYGQQILKVTGGKGVNIVMNSLTGPGFKEATLGACAQGARFVEMSKLSIWTEEEVKERRPDVVYSIIDLTKLDEESSRKLLAESRKLVDEGVVKPIPYTRFDAQNIKDALTYLQKAHHIGKVVVIMPESKATEIGTYTPLFNDRSSYLITGGLGGIGMEVCKYMVEQGGKHIVLVGRKPPNDKAIEVINSLNKEKGANVVVIQGDVGDWESCKRVIEQIEATLPPLRGIMHSAGTLSDGLIDNLKWSDFQNTYQAKVSGSWNLHSLTKNKILEHFVLFSSITAPFGSPGQATHVSACTFEDAFTDFRNTHGLPATSINWGQFSQIGVAAEADVVSIRPFTPQQGINALDHIVRHNKNNFVVAALEDALAAILKFLPYTKRVVDESVVKNAGGILAQKNKKLEATSALFWEEYNDCKDDREGKVGVLKFYTKKLLRHVLRLDADEPIDENTDLQDMGVDSLMMLELKNHIQEILGDKLQITQSAMKDCNTVLKLSERLVQIIEEEGDFSSVTPPTMEETKELADIDCKLPEELKAAEGAPKKASEIKVVLVTGATGLLGSHFLREMLEEAGQLEKVYCLVRTKGGESAEERLSQILERKCVMSHMKNFNKVIPISGNVIENRLGLKEEDYEVLVKEVDAVVHCGAKVNHTEFYRNVDGGRNDARTVNVKGLLKLLEFCGSGGKTKHLLNASTLLAVFEVNPDDETLSETWPEVKNLHVATNRGYQLSKYICDLLLGQAVQRGIPCKSFHFAELRGSKVTGGSLVDSSHFMRSFLFFLKSGVIPETPIASNFIPIDVASRIACRVMFNDSAPDQPYNVSHPQPQLVQEYFPGLAQEMGHTVEIVTFEEYRSKVLEGEGAEQQAGLITEFTDLYKDEEAINTLFSGATDSLRKCFENVENFWKSKRLVDLVPDLYNDHMETSCEIVKRDFHAAKREGIFEKLGL